jgi:hypothetical protein
MNKYRTISGAKVGWTCDYTTRRILVKRHFEKDFVKLKRCERSHNERLYEDG